MPKISLLVHFRDPWSCGDLIHPLNRWMWVRILPGWVLLTTVTITIKIQIKPKQTKSVLYGILINKR